MVATVTDPDHRPGGGGDPGRRATGGSGSTAGRGRWRWAERIMAAAQAATRPRSVPTPSPSSSSRTAPPAGRQQEGFTRAGHLGPVPVRPPDIGGHQSQPAHALLGADEAAQPGDDVEGGGEPVLGDGAGRTERAADILVVDDVVDQAFLRLDHPGDALSDVVTVDAVEHGQDLVRGVRRPEGDRFLQRGLRHVEPPASQLDHHGAERRGVAHAHVADHVAHPPVSAQARMVPVLRAQPVQELADGRQFLQPHLVCVHGSSRSRMARDPHWPFAGGGGG
jgi:hypothetical protein